MVSWPETRVVYVVRVLDWRREVGAMEATEFAKWEGDACGGGVGVGVEDGLGVFGGEAIELDDAFEDDDSADEPEDEEDDCGVLV